MNIKTLTYLLWRRVDGGIPTDDSRYTYRELKSYIVAGIANALKNSYFEQRNLEDYKYGDDSITTTYKTTIQTDSETGLKYVPLENKTIISKYDYDTLVNKTISVAGGRFTNISSINPIGKYAKNYVPIRLEERIIVANQPCVPNVVYFYKQDGKAFFYGETPTESSVYVSDRYAIPNDDEAELTLPAEFENNIIQQALQLLLPNQVLSDRQNNGVPNT